MRIVEQEYPSLDMTVWLVYNDQNKIISPAFRSREEAEEWYTARTGESAPAPTQPEPTLVDMPTPGTSQQPQQPAGFPMGLLVAGAAVGIFVLMLKE